MNRLRVLYENGKLEEYEESSLAPGYYGWDRLSDERIVRLETILESTGISMLLSGYEAYNLLVRRNVNKPLPLGIWLMGRSGDSIDVTYLSFEEGTLYRDKLPIGRELEGVGSLGWREGYIPEGAIPGTYALPLKLH